MKMKIVSEKMKYEEPRIEVVNLDLGEGVCQASTDYENVGVSSEYGDDYQLSESDEHWDGSVKF